MKLFLRILSLAIVAYLISDLLLFEGPLNRKLDAFLTKKAAPLAALVDGFPITQSQLDRATEEQLWLDGKTSKSVTPDDLKAVRERALQELIDHELLRLQVQALSAQLTVSAAEIDERIRRLVGRFESKGALETAMKSQGIADEAALRSRFSTYIQQEKFVQLRIGSATKVSDEEANEWFTKNQSVIALPERVEARHVFIPTLDFPAEVAKQKLDIALAALTNKTKDFAALAGELSHDPATKSTGGSLGWMTRDRLPADFAAPVFALELNKPTLIRTKLGWHLVEVTARKAAETRSFDQAKPEIVAALAADKSRLAVERFRTSLRQINAAKVQIF